MKAFKPNYRVLLSLVNQTETALYDRISRSANVALSGLWATVDNAARRPGYIYPKDYVEEKFA